MKQFACGDVVPGCTRTFRGSDDEAVLASVARHAQHDHGLATVPDHLVVEVRRNIRTA